MTFKRFFVSGIPQSKGSFTPAKNKKGDYTGKMYNACEDTKIWEDTVAWMARRVANDEPANTPIDLNLDFILGENPGVWIEIREIGLSELEYHPAKPDIDKLARAVMDGLAKGGIYKNDSQVVRIEAQKLKKTRG